MQVADFQAVAENYIYTYTFTDFWGKIQTHQQKRKSDFQSGKSFLFTFGEMERGVWMTSRENIIIFD